MAKTDDPLDQRGHTAKHHAGSSRNVDLITTDDTLKQIADKAQSAGIIRRKNEAEVRTDYYYDIDIEAHIRHLLDHQFAVPDNMKHQISWRNVVKMIIRKTALVYKDPPVREIFIESMKKEKVPDPENKGQTIEQNVKVFTPSQKDQDLWDEIEKKTNLNVLLKTVNRMTQLTRRVVVKVGFDKEADMVKLSIILPNILDIVVDKNDVLKPLAMFWNVSTVKRINTGNIRGDKALAAITADKLEYEFWSTDSDKLTEDLRGKNFIFNGKGEITPVEDNPTNENKVKDLDKKSIIPVVEFAAEMPVDDWFVGGGSDLINAQETINVLLTYLNYMVKMQSFSIPVWTGAKANEAQDAQGGGKDSPAVIIDPSMAIILEQSDNEITPQKFEFVTADAKIVEVKELIREKIVDIATDYAISIQNFAVQSAPSSGVAIKLQNQELLDFRADEIDLYRHSEQDLFETIRNVHNQFRKGKKFTKEAQMKTNFAEIKFPEDPKSTLEALQMGIDLGVTSAVAFVMMQDPDLNEKEAEELVTENLKKKRKTTNGVPSVENGIIAPQTLNLNPNVDTVEDELTPTVPPEQFTDSQDVEL